MGLVGWRNSRAAQWWPESAPHNPKGGHLEDHPLPLVPRSAGEKLPGRQCVIQETHKGKKHETGKDGPRQGREIPRVSQERSVWRDTFEGYAVKPGCSLNRLVLRSHKTMSHIAI